GALSGGEKQRVFIAKAIASRPDLLVMDEPTAGVDPESERRFYDLLGRLKDELGLTVIFVSHDLGVVSARVDRVACLNRTLVYEGPPRALHDEALLRTLYGGGTVTIAHSEEEPHTHGHEGVPMATDLLSIFQFGFMQRALIAGLVIATVCGVLGVFVVLRRTAPLGDALAEVSCGGVAIGIAAGLSPIEMAILIAVLGGIGIRVLRERHLYGELSLTVIQAARLGGGVVVISMVGGLNVEILSFLFGQSLTVTWSDFALIVVLLAATILVLAVLYKEFFL